VFICGSWLINTSLPQDGAKWQQNNYFLMTVVMGVFVTEVVFTYPCSSDHLWLVKYFLRLYVRKENGRWL